MKTRSGVAFLHERNLIINMDHVKIPVGYGNRSHIGKSSDRYFKLHKKSIFSPNLRDEDYCLCLAVSIIVAIAHSIGNLSKYYYLTYAGHYNELILKLFSIYYLMKQNYSFVSSPTAAFSTAYFCGYCCIGYTTKFGHTRCRSKCNKCFQSPPCTNDAIIKCNSCKRDFVNAT